MRVSDEVVEQKLQKHACVHRAGTLSVQFEVALHERAQFDLQLVQHVRRQRVGRYRAIAQSEQHLFGEQLGDQDDALKSGKVAEVFRIDKVGVEVQRTILKRFGSGGATETVKDLTAELDPPPDGRPCEPTCLTARAARYYIARKTWNHYTEE